jgi:hypothetical protein
MLELDKLVRIRGKLWGTPEMKELALRCEEEGLAAAYSLWTGRDEQWGIHLEDKDGQARTGDVIGRCLKRLGESISRGILLDIIVDPYFSEPGQDNKLNKYRNDDRNDPVDLVRGENDVSSTELMRYYSFESFCEGPLLKRQALAKLTGDPLVGTTITKLHTTQFRMAALAVKLHRSGHSSLLAHLCARFGKTLYSGPVAYMLKEYQVVVVASYVKTSFYSFMTQWGKSRQLKQEFVQINTEHKNWKEDLNKAISDGKRVVLFLSLCPGNNRQDRIDYIGSLPVKRHWLEDEGDFGGHTENQVNALKQGIKDGDLFDIMTGTNPDRAVANWSGIRQFHPISVVYEELLIQKTETKNGSEYLIEDEFEKDLALNFAIDSMLDLTIPDQVRIVQDLIGLVNKHKVYLESQEIDGDWDPAEFAKLPTFRKMSLHPNKCRPVWVDLFRSSGPGLTGFEHFNIDLFIEEEGLPQRTRYTCKKTGNEILVEQHFCSATKKNLDIIAECARDGRPAWFVQATHGGTGYSNETYEQKIEKLMAECAERGQNLLIISNHLGQRSYSNGFQSTVSLTYDNGEWGTTMQKESRGLSMNEGDYEKAGYIVIPSLDPNRDIRPYIGAITAVKNLGPKYPKMSAKDLLKHILPSLNIFVHGADGSYFRIDADKTVETLYNNGLIKQILGATQNIGCLSPESRKAWLNATGYTPPSQDKETGDEGETFSSEKPKTGKADKKQKTSEEIEKFENAKIRAAMTLLFDKFHILQIGTGCRTVEDILTAIQTDADHKEFFTETFNIDIDTILRDIKTGAIQTKALEMSLT